MLNRMGALAGIALLSICMGTAVAASSSDLVEKPEWKDFFDAQDTVGTMVVKDMRGRGAVTYVYNPDRSDVRFTPASTFKIPHTLFALDAGAVSDEFQVFKWDGTVNEIPTHNADQNLRSAMRNSAVWVYRGFAEKIGSREAARYLSLIHYGNADPTVKQRDYWINGGLKVSAREQVHFLESLYRNQLPFKLEHQLLTKDVLIVGAGRDWIMRAKTGLGGQIGWWVGWVEFPDGPVIFALNIDTPKRMADAPKREAIGRQVLESMGALPEHRN
ncbi:class D beta-lactamase [Pseudomonas soli]|jgi:beta-lactamase class D|uniref:beta-lactamase n=2 Tax=cellular organisms TaxID=131567 RepID=A0A2A2JWK1_9BILA|nr:MULTISPECIES: class D beta-lactamase [Pseudomonas]PAV66085.1 hypothetical protein WR25_08774 [Diploscapter pachys]AUY31844.1 class D beta-lactamase [Pseudomonas sp. PONIH3]MDT3716787.1 class D beta-lactamase [Pseudomonas soli]MDT3733462.1 class D beta-lactamase [Pseudomonas soli]MEE1880831.1 class D beta-lactamase [Pseudomonas soli]